MEPLTFLQLQMIEKLVAKIRICQENNTLFHFILELEDLDDTLMDIMSQRILEEVWPHQEGRGMTSLNHLEYRLANDLYGSTILFRRALAHGVEEREYVRPTYVLTGHYQ